MQDFDEQPRQTETPATDGGDRDVPLSWELRVMLIALVGLIPGLQLGCILGLLLSTSGTAFYWILAAGGLLGMIAGGTLEADCWL
jgi:hypothetical protein